MHLDNSLEVSFSRVQYVDIAPRFGLEASAQVYDIPSFPMFHARITNSLFREILEEIREFTYQYRPLEQHETEEARSRYLSAVRPPPRLDCQADNRFVVFQ